MQKKAVIPTSPSQRWREFRIRIIPRFTLVTVVFSIFLLWRQNVVTPTSPGQEAILKAEVTSPNSGYITNLYVVRFQEVKKDELIAKIVSFESSRSDAQIAVLRAPISGAISMIYRSEGERVDAGEPILQITDLTGHSEVVTNMALIRREVPRENGLPVILPLPVAIEKLRASSDLGRFARRN